MNGKVLSIEIGKFLTKICEMDYKTKNNKIYHSFTVETPVGMLDDGMIISNDFFLEQLKKNLEDRKIRTKQIIFTIASTKIASREVMIPFIKENRITNLVRTNASSYFPIDITNYHFSHNILNVETDEKGVKLFRLQILAAPNQLIESYYAIAQALKMEVIAIDYIGNSIYQAVKSESSDITKMIIKMDDYSTLLIIVKNNTIALTRTIPQGTGEGIHAMMEAKQWGEKLTYLEAMEIAKTESVLHLNGDVVDAKSIENQMGSDKEGLLQKAKQEVTQSFSTLVGGIIRVIDYYHTTNGADSIQSFVLTGTGGNFSQLDTLLTQEIGTKIETLTTIQSLNTEKLTGPLTIGEFIGCIGATIDPLNFYTHANLDGKNKKNAQVDYTVVSIGVLLVCIVTTALLGVIAFVPYQSEKKTQETLTQRKEELLPVKDIYQNYLNATAGYEKITGWDDASYNALDQFVEFIEELENKMPSTFVVQSFMADSMGATLEVKVDSKEAAASVMDRLRTFEKIESIMVPSITEVGSDTGEKQIVFSVSIVFGNLNIENTVE